MKESEATEKGSSENGNEFEMERELEAAENGDNLEIKEGSKVTRNKYTQNENDFQMKRG